jgi:glyoxylase-like metal-dependent hydrolase (beta-lactamase superfamily II)
LRGDSIKVEHFGPGHTDGDVWVYFEKADVVALGDTFWNGNYPFIDSKFFTKLMYEGL